MHATKSDIYMTWALLVLIQANLNSGNLAGFPLTIFGIALITYSLWRMRDEQ